MQKLELELPDSLANESQPYRDRVEEVLRPGLQQLHITEALLLYSRGLVSFARAAELAGLPHDEMVRQARAAGVQPRWLESMVREDLA